jgi:hypothetical protein
LGHEYRNGAKDALEISQSSWNRAKDALDVQKNIPDSRPVGSQRFLVNGAKDTLEKPQRSWNHAKASLKGQKKQA